MSLQCRRGSSKQIVETQEKTIFAVIQLFTTRSKAVRMVDFSKDSTEFLLPNFILSQYHSYLVAASGFVGNFVIIISFIRKPKHKDSPKHEHLILSNSLFSLSHIAMFVATCFLAENRDNKTLLLADFFKWSNFYGLYFLSLIFSAYRFCKTRNACSRFMKIFQLLPLILSFGVFYSSIFLISLLRRKLCSRSGNVCLSFDYGNSFDSVYFSFSIVFAIISFITLGTLWMMTPKFETVDNNLHQNSSSAAGSFSNRKLRQLAFTLSFETSIEERIFLSRVKILTLFVGTVALVAFCAGTSLYLILQFHGSFEIHNKVALLTVQFINQWYVLTTQAIYALNPIFLTVRFWRKVPKNASGRARISLV